jgi:hypothetical protein
MRHLITLLTAGVLIQSASAVYLLEVDTDGLDDGTLTYNANFSFGGDTTTASQSSPSSAVFMSSADSIFGGNGTVEPDTYVYTYTPSVDGDNIAAGPGVALNDDGDLTSGLLAGDSTEYRVYVTYPLSSNISGGLTNYELVTGERYTECFVRSEQPGQ